MKIPVYSLEMIEIKKIDLPIQFNEEIRPDLISRVVHSIEANTRQPYGAFLEAGKRASVEISKRRKDYRGCYGHGISRTPRKILSRRGMRMNWVGAFAPNTVGGRRAHPPKAYKVWEEKVNKKERRKAIRSALACVVSKSIVEERGHIIPSNYPFIIENKFEDIAKTKEAVNTLKKLGFEKELERVKSKKIRAGRGKTRGRKYVLKKGPLFVVSKKCNAMKSLKNIPGIDVVEVKDINCQLLAPGSKAGRATIFTEGAIELLAKNKLFM